MLWRPENRSLRFSARNPDDSISSDGRVLCVMSRGWFSTRLVAASVELCLASTAYAATTRPTIAKCGSASLLSCVTNSKTNSSPVPWWVVIEEEAHAGKVARRLLLLKSMVDPPCPGLLELQEDR